MTTDLARLSVSEEHAVLNFAGRRAQCETKNGAERPKRNQAVEIASQCGQSRRLCSEKMMNASPPIGMLTDRPREVT